MYPFEYCRIVSLIESRTGDNDGKFRPQDDDSADSAVDGTIYDQREVTMMHSRCRGQ